MATRTLLPSLLLYLLAVGLPAPAGAADELPGTALRAALAEFDAHARFPLPALSDDAIQRLLDGKVVTIRDVPEDPEAPQRVVGLLRSDLAPQELWLGAMDPHFVAMDSLTEVRISPDGQWPTRWYQYLVLPWPFQARHWVIDVSNNLELAERSEDRSWEHWWDLTSGGPETASEVVAQGRIPGVDTDRASRAIYTPVNRGAWVVLSLADGSSLLGYHVSTVVGGRIPDKAVADYTLLTMKKLLRGVVERGRGAAEHYDASHEPLISGNGRPLLPRAAEPDAPSSGQR